MDKYRNICKDYQISFMEKIYFLPWYCKIFTTRYIKSVICFWWLNWTKSNKKLKKDTKTKIWLNRWPFANIWGLSNINHGLKTPKYYNSAVGFQKFLNTWSKKKNWIRIPKSAGFFIAFLPSIQFKLVNCYSLDLSRGKALDFDDILKKS